METFGIDLLLDSQRNNIKTKNDILVIFMHWMLVKNKVKNVGVGDNVSRSFITISMGHPINSQFCTYLETSMRRRSTIRAAADRLER